MRAPEGPGPGICFLDLLRLVSGAVIHRSVAADQIGFHGSRDAAVALACVGTTGEARALSGSPLPPRELRAAIRRSIPALTRVGHLNALVRQRRLHPLVIHHPNLLSLQVVGHAPLPADVRTAGNSWGRHLSLASSRWTTLMPWQWLLQCGPSSRHTRRSNARKCIWRHTTALRRRSGFNHVPRQGSTVSLKACGLEPCLLQLRIRQQLFELSDLLLQLDQPRLLRGSLATSVS